MELARAMAAAPAAEGAAGGEAEERGGPEEAESIGRTEGGPAGGRALGRRSAIGSSLVPGHAIKLQLSFPKGNPQLTVDNQELAKAGWGRSGPRRLKRTLYSGNIAGAGV